MRTLQTRFERLVPRAGQTIEVRGTDAGGVGFQGKLGNLSPSGLLVFCAEGAWRPAITTRLGAIRLTHGQTSVEAGPGVVLRAEAVAVEGAPTGLLAIAVRFDEPNDALLEGLAAALDPKPYVTHELRDDLPPVVTALNAENSTLLDFYQNETPDLLEKCQRFSQFIGGLQTQHYFQSLYRVTLTSPLDHQIVAFNPIRRTEQAMICFDSNSYFSLHLHPRVLAATRRALDLVGYGSPSAQLLCGTNRYLRELEETVARFHGREEALIYSSGYMANEGAILGLVRKGDWVIRDQYSHASIHAGCRAVRSPNARHHPHEDMAALEAILQEAEAAGDGKPRLIATDGVFSMHGRIAKLPELMALARKYKATVLLDEAHATGIIGPTGRGTEEHFGLRGSVDVLVGTFSKVPGTVGGYVCGSRELITYLRFYSPTAIFTATIPAALCAGIVEAYRILEEEPEHRLQLHQNVRTLVEGMRAAGLPVDDTPSAILTVFLGNSKLMLKLSRDLFDRGVKAGVVDFPAVPLGGAILRLALNSRHTPEELHQTIDILTDLGRKYGILHRTPEEILEIGSGLSLDGPEAGSP